MNVCSQLIRPEERLLCLERDQARLLVTLQESGLDIAIPTSAGGQTDPANGMVSRARKVDLGRSGSLNWRDYGSRSDDDREPVRKASGLLAGYDSQLTLQGLSRRAERRASMQFPSSLASSTTSTMPPPPLSSDSATFKERYTSTTMNGNFPFDSPSNHLTANASSNNQKLGVQAPPLTRMMSGSSILAATASPPAHISTTPNIHHIPPNTNLQSTNPAKAPQQTASTSAPTGQSSAAQLDGPSDQDKSKAKDAANNAAKSFRVTLEDPCWKVLPAALKKYKINDDWKKYALFICFGNTGRSRKARPKQHADRPERCLSYDEKPLMLFQKLKEGGHKPVFMLRHIVGLECRPGLGC
jgi:hypothetical protein